jgi:uncharacterized membrane protein
MTITEEDIISILNWIGGLVCHQKRERTLRVGELYLPVCARDTGIYIGFFLGYLLLPLRNKRSRGPPDLLISFIMILPLIVDSLTQNLGLRVSMNEIRLISGLFFGTALSPLLIYLLAILPTSHRIPVIRSFIPENVEIDSKNLWIGRKTLILGFIIDLAIFLAIRFAEGLENNVFYWMLSLSVIGSIILHVFALPIYVVLALLERSITTFFKNAIPSP